MTAEERDALVNACHRLDPTRSGDIPETSLGTVLDAIGEKVHAERAGLASVPSV